VVSISDSFAWGAVPHHFQFTTVCERLLPGVEVMNFGYSATGPDVYAYILRHYGKALYPDLVLVNIFVGNDLDELIEPDPHPFLRRLFDRDHLLVYKIPQRLLILRREATRRAREHALAPETPALHLSDNPLAIQEAPAIEVNRLSNVYPWLDDPRLEPPTLSLPSFLDIETRRAYSICNPLGLGDERMDRFFARIQDIIAAAGNTPIVFMIIPDEFQVEDDLWEMVQHRIPAMKLDRDQAQRALLEWFGRNGASCIDLLPHLRAVPPLEDGRRHLYHLRDTHFNRRGNEVAGRVLGETIRARYASQR
jgi:hypothetical protein